MSAAFPSGARPLQLEMIPWAASVITSSSCQRAISMPTSIFTTRRPVLSLRSGYALREENRHAVLQKRTRPEPLRRGRLRLPPAAHTWRRAPFSPLILADSLAL
jgi:hypothetical protein